jgi:hypothetical protein
LLVLDLWDTRGMLEGNGLIDLGRTLVGVGLQPVSGRSSENPSVPSDDPLFWAGIEVEDTPPRGRLRPTRTWACRLVASTSTEHAGFALFEAAVLSPAVNTIQVTLGPPAIADGEAIDAWSSWAGLILQQAGTALYERTRPAVGAIMTISAGRAAPWQNDLARRVVDGKELVVGWRTWFGPERAEIHGRDVLLDLPGKAWMLDDGGIGHALGAPISSLVHRQPEIFAAVWDYLEQQDLMPAWPRAATRPAKVRDEQLAAPVLAPVTPGMQLDKLIREYLHPRLRKAGFRAAGATFRRLVSGNWQIVNVQRSRHSPADSVRFAVNLGVASRRATAAEIREWGTRRLSCWDCDLQWRLGALVHNGHDHWWSIDAQTPLAPLGNELVQHLESAAFPHLDKYATDEAMRDLWLRGRSTGLSRSTRVRLRRLLEALGPRELLDEIPLDDDEGDRKPGEQDAAELQKVLRQAGFQQVADKANPWLAPPDWPERASN